MHDHTTNNKNKFPFNGMEVAAIISDFDGTLIDSERHMAKMAIQASQELKPENPLTEEIVFSLIGKYFNQAESVVRTILKDPIYPYREIKQRSYELGDFFFKKNGLHLKAGAKELIILATKKNIPFAIASVNSREIIAETMKSFSLYNKLSAIIGREDVGQDLHWNKKYIFEKAAKELGVSIHKCLILEDSESGVEAGLEAKGIVIHIKDVQTLSSKIASKVYPLNNMHEVVMALNNTKDSSLFSLDNPTDNPPEEDLLYTSKIRT